MKVREIVEFLTEELISIKIEDMNRDVAYLKYRLYMYNKYMELENTIKNFIGMKQKYVRKLSKSEMKEDIVTKMNEEKEVLVFEYKFNNLILCINYEILQNIYFYGFTTIVEEQIKNIKNELKKRKVKDNFLDSNIEHYMLWENERY